jgi:hypothetical protein
LAAESFEILAAAMDHAASSIPEDQLRGTGIGYIQFAIRAPEQFRLMWRTELLDQTSPRLQKAMERLRQRLRDALISACKQANHRAPSEAALSVRFNLAWCCVHGYACLWVEGDRKSHALSDAEKMLLALRPVLTSR